MPEAQDVPSDRTRSIELEIEVPGTPEEVWEAIATGPGITAWFVPTSVVGEVGGEVRQRFGAAEEMQVEGRVQAWEPPHRFAYGERVEPDGGMAFEFLVEAREGGTCVVRLVNSGFGEGDDWDAQYDAMESGWGLFLQNLRLHLELFRGQTAVAVLPMVSAPGAGGRDAAWARLVEALGLDPDLADGSDLVAAGSAPAPLAGRVRTGTAGLVSIVLEHPAPGTGILAVEGEGDNVSVSVWMYLYGPEAAAAAARDEPVWQAWLEELYGAV